MTAHVPEDRIEDIVGVKRHPTAHYGRAVSAEQTVYILHSHECKDSTPDLRECPFSFALDRGIEDAFPWSAWRRVQDEPTKLRVAHGYLMPEKWWLTKDGAEAAAVAEDGAGPR